MRHTRLGPPGANGDRRRRTGREHRGSRDSPHIRREPRRRTDCAGRAGEGRHDPSCPGARGRLVAGTLSGPGIRGARGRHRQYRRGRGRRRPFCARCDRRARRAAGRFDCRGGKGLPYARTGRDHRREACRRCGLPRSPGCRRRRSCSTKRGSGAPSTSTSPRTPGCCWRKRSSSAAPAWARR